MAYIKPQYPLKSGENYIYPPTTADQVIIGDGKRLSGVGVYLDKPDEGEETTVVGVNADTLGGIAASNYITKEDIASAQKGSWNGNTLPSEIPKGISYVVANDDGEERGFPVGYATVLSINDNIYRVVQILIEKTNGRMQIRSATDGTTWGEWQSYLRKSDAAADSAKLGGKTWAERLLEIYPVGSIYMSVNSTSPASLFGGTWELLKDRFLIGAGGSYALGSEGGEENHQLTINEIPNHNHDLAFSATSSGGKYFGIYHGKVNEYTNPGNYNTVGVLDAGGSQPHNNMPPYLAINIWRRVA